MSGLLLLASNVATAILFVALFLALVRLARGPSLADRAVAFELVAMVVVGLAVTNALRTGESLLLRPALVVALVGFLGTVAVARHLEGREDP